MKKLIIFLSLGILLATGVTRAQVPIALPNGSFEQWTNHQGYNVLYVIPVYSAYTTPTGWDYLSYPVNQSVSGYNINTDIPLIKASQATGSVPDGSKALKLESFMISDILSPTILSVAGDMLDTSLTQRVIPSILSIGDVDVNALIPLLTSVLSGTEGITSMLSSMDTMNVNDYISGGMPLGSFSPGRLTGNYKYQSATSGDNGGVLVIGTRYNTTNNRREVVGAGVNMSLTDTNEYVPFEVEYLPIDIILPDATNANTEPDSLLVFIVSSAGMNMQQGSALFIDNLKLWPAPESCVPVQSLTVGDNGTTVTSDNQILGYVASWVDTSATNQWQVTYVEYGMSGLISGVTDTVTSPTFVFPALEPEAMYSVAVTPLCGLDNTRSTRLVSFTTRSLTGIDNVGAIAMKVSPNPSRGQCTVTPASSQPTEMRLYSLDGRLLKTITSMGEPVVIQMPAAGVFLLEAHSAEGVSITKIVNE